MNCSECGKKLIIRRDQVGLFTTSDYFEIRDLDDEKIFYKFKQERDSGSIEHEEYLCDHCESDLSEEVLDKLLAQLEEHGE